MPTQTKVEVRVVAAGGKFLGGDIGGAEVVLRDARDGQVLARGTVRGDSGVTKDIMQEKHFWAIPLPYKQASKFVATLSLDEPRLVRVTAYGPLGALASARTVTSEQWVVPGQDLCGDRAVVMVMPGLIVQVLRPATHTEYTSPAEVQITANVGMMCGCPIEAGAGPWPAEDFVVQAFVESLGDDGATPVATVTLEYAGTPSRFNGEWRLETPGFYQITVVAAQTGSPNTGLDRATVFWLPSTPAA